MQSTSITIRGRRTSWIMSLIGIAPLSILAVMLVLTDRNNAGFLPLLDAFKTLSAITLTYLGGIRFGMALRDNSMRPLAMGATLLPGIVGWMSLFLPDVAAVSLLLLSVCAMGAWDSLTLHGRVGPSWFTKIRTVMTLLAAFVHTAVLLAIL